MLCEMCQKKTATVHFNISRAEIGESSPPVKTEYHYCEECADEYYKKSGMNAFRDLMQLSNRYRSKLYDILEAKQPEVFRAGNERRGAEAMRRFLWDQLTQEGVKLEEDVFGMLFHGFVGSSEFYERRRRLFGDGRS
jgi:hypothetical protein